MKLRLPIDLKSLYLNIKNDNKTGHTATVATPIRQGSSVHEELAQIKTIPEEIFRTTREELSTQILSKSRAEAIIPNIYVFDQLCVNGERIECAYSFCMYIREETDPSNVHCGRQKLHYPPSLNYEDEYVKIDNKQVMMTISEKLKNYAFIVEAFEYDIESKTLNFDVLIVGENGIPYSKVFLNKKGVGNKFTSVFSYAAENYDTEIISLREHLGYDNVNPDNYGVIQERNKDAAIAIIMQELERKGGSVRRLSGDYPYALFDIEVKYEDKKEYYIVKNTSTKMTYFSLPFGKIKFCIDFKDKTKLALVKDINGNPMIEWFTSDEINMMNKSISTVTYEKRG